MQIYVRFSIDEKFRCISRLVRSTGGLLSLMYRLEHVIIEVDGRGYILCVWF